MSYFIFGGSGFIGTHLIALIDNLYPGPQISIVMFVLK